MTTFVPNSVILYVSDVEASTTFYSRILGHEPIKTYPGFSVFALSDDVTLLTWLIVGWLGCLGAGCCWDCGGCVGWGAH